MFYLKGLFVLHGADIQESREVCGINKYRSIPQQWEKYKHIVGARRTASVHTYMGVT